MVRPLSLYQWGKETVRGTAVPATSKILCHGIDFEAEDEVYRPQHALGIGFENPGQEFVVRRGSKFTVPDFPINYEQLPHWLLMALKGAVTPTGTDPYTWTFTPALGADPALEARTLERRLTDGAASIDYEWAYAMLSKLGIKWTTGQPIMIGAEGFARRVQGSTLTPALTAPTPENVPAELVTVAIDATWATLGVTAIAAQILSGEFGFDTGYLPFASADGRTDLDFTSHEFNPRARRYTLKLRCLVKNAGQFATEKTAAEAQTLRAVRLRWTGSDGATARRVTIDALYKHVPGSLFKVDEIDGQDVVDFDLVQSTDATNALAVVVINHVATSA